MTTRAALVTGASRGIGRAVAHTLAGAGYRVIVHYQSNHDSARDTLASLPGDGHILLPANLADPDAIPGLAADALAHAGGAVSVFVHNAGIYLPSPLLGEDAFSAFRANIRAQMQVNFLAGADLACLLAPGMADAGWGRIIHVSSRAGLRGEAGRSGYAASKAAQVNFIRSLSMELAPRGIGCFAVAPGWTQTDMATDALATRGEQIRREIPAGRVALPEDIASLIAFLVTPAADYLTGNTIDVTGASYLH